MRSDEPVETAPGHTPTYQSLALRDIPTPDYCDVVIVPTRGVREPDPAVWAEAMFSHDNATLAARGMQALKDEAVRMFDLVPGPGRVREVAEVRGSEALIVDDAPTRHVRIGVALEPGGDLLRVTTAVKYRTIAGKIAFAPRRLVHAATLHTLARRTPVTLRRREAAQLASGKVGVFGIQRLPRAASRVIEASRSADCHE